MLFIDDNDISAPSAPTTHKKKNSFTSRQIFIHPPSRIPSPASSDSVHKRRPLLQRDSHSSNSGRFAEFAGGTAAECAAICCCCPCGLANLLYLTVYKVPAGLCRRALRGKRRKQMIKKGLLPPRTRRCYRCGGDDMEIQINHHHHSSADGLDIKSETDGSSEGEEDEEAMVKLEKEMWEKFYGTGFWRSPSQREPPSFHVIDPPKATVKQL